MISRNPNGATPRTMSDCTFQSWADPIERPIAEKTPRIIKAYLSLLVIAAALAALWRFMQ
jgi:hypothetical protein